MIKLISIVRRILLEDQSDELIKIARSPNGLISPKGEVYHVPAIKHMEFFVAHVPKYKDFKKRFAAADSDQWEVLYNALYTDAYEDGWIRIRGDRGHLGFRGSKKGLSRHKGLLDDITLFVKSVHKKPIKVFMEPVK